MRLKNTVVWEVNSLLRVKKKKRSVVTSLSCFDYLAGRKYPIGQSEREKKVERKSEDGSGEYVHKENKNMNLVSNVFGCLFRDSLAPSAVGVIK